MTSQDKLQQQWEDLSLEQPQAPMRNSMRKAALNQLCASQLFLYHVQVRLGGEEEDGGNLISCFTFSSNINLQQV